MVVSLKNLWQDMQILLQAEVTQLITSGEEQCLKWSFSPPLGRMRMVVLHGGCYGHTYSGTDRVEY